jgi:hypothetical protein
VYSNTARLAPQSIERLVAAVCDVRFGRRLDDSRLEFAVNSCVREWVARVESVVGLLRVAGVKSLAAETPRATTALTSTSWREDPFDVT